MKIALYRNTVLSSFTLLMMTLVISHAVEGQISIEECFPGKLTELNDFLDAHVAGDFDGDNDLDVAATFASGPNQEQVLILTNDGSGKLSLSGRFGAFNERKENIATADLDDDGDLDLVISNARYGQSAGEIAVLFNDGSGAFETQVTYMHVPQATDLELGDLNGDSHIDIAFSGVGLFTIMLNDGSGGFSDPAYINLGTNSRSMVMGDMDGDQDLDFATANINSENISVLVNDGAGNFTEQTYNAGFSPDKIFIGDVDGDQDLDVGVKNQGFPYITILTNDGDASFFISNIFLAPETAQIIFVDDFDGDSDLDIFDGKSWHLNSGGGTFGPSIPVLFGTADVNLYADLNSDGNSDFLYSVWGLNSIDNFAVAKGNGNGTYDTGTFFQGDEEIRPSDQMISVDLNGDMFPDIVQVNPFDGIVAFQLNDGSGSFGQATIVDTGEEPTAVDAADIDGDNDVDLVVTNKASSTVSVFINDGQADFIQGDVVLAGNAPSDVKIEDVNGDGRCDLLVVSEFQGTSLLGISLGNASGSFDDCQFFGGDSSSLRPVAIAVGDIDGDLDKDAAILYRHETTFDTHGGIFLNDGAGQFSEQPAFFIGLGQPKNLKLADLDNDLNLDIIVMHKFRNSVVVFPGNGDGSIQPHFELELAESSDDIVACDIDGDNDLDLIASTIESVSVLENDNGAFWPATRFAAPGSTGIAVGDFNGDLSCDIACSIPGGIFVLSNKCPNSVVIKQAIDIGVIHGSVLNGSLSSLTASDEVKLSVARSRTDVQPKVVLELQTTSPLAAPGEMEFSLEGSAFARTDIYQKVELFNFADNVWQEFADVKASQFMDVMSTVSITEDVSDFIHQETGAVKTRLSFNSPNPRASFAVNLDLVRWAFHE